MGHADPDRAREYQREWRRRNPDQSRVLHKRWRVKVRLAALVAYSGDPPFCACCGEREPVFLCLDHVDGNGAEERRRLGTSSGSGALLAGRLSRLGFPPGYRVLCWNCNSAIGLHGICPHAISRTQTPASS